MGGQWANRRGDRTTIKAIALPPLTDSIWKLGHKHVAVAHAICEAMAALNPDRGGK